MKSLTERAFFAGFKASAEGYNGEYPYYSDEKFWAVLKEDYNKWIASLDKVEPRETTTS